MTTSCLGLVCSWIPPLDKLRLLMSLRRAAKHLEWEKWHGWFAAPARQCLACQAYGVSVSCESHRRSKDHVSADPSPVALVMSDQTTFIGQHDGIPKGCLTQPSAASTSASTQGRMFYPAVGGLVPLAACQPASLAVRQRPLDVTARAVKRL